MNILGLIPARSGSKRLPAKNMAIIQDETLVARALRIASEASVFVQIACSTDSEAIAQHIRELGFKAILRPSEMATDTSRDVEWVTHAFGELGAANCQPWVDYHYVDAFCILRPTSPFRTPETVQRAVKQFEEQVNEIDSLRAVQPVSERPEKMWVYDGATVIPRDYDRLRVGHYRLSLDMADSQSSGFEPVFIQNGCIHIAWSRVLPESVSGNMIAAFFTEGREGFDINEPRDLEYARYLVERITQPKGKPYPWPIPLPTPTNEAAGER